MLVFDWDDANRDHIAEHDVAPLEAEQVILNDPLDLDVQVSEAEERYVQVGETNRGRVLRVISTVRGPSVRVVTAYDAPKRDRLAYEEWRFDIYGTEA